MTAADLAKHVAQIAQIRASSAEDRDKVLTSLLKTAWPTKASQHA